MACFSDLPTEIREKIWFYCLQIGFIEILKPDPWILWNYTYSTEVLAGTFHAIRRLQRRNLDELKKPIALFLPWFTARRKFFANLVVDEYCRQTRDEQPVTTYDKTTDVNQVLEGRRVYHAHNHCATLYANRYVAGEMTIDLGLDPIERYEYCRSTHLSLWHVQTSLKTYLDAGRDVMHFDGCESEDSRRNPPLAWLIGKYQPQNRTKVHPSELLQHRKGNRCVACHHDDHLRRDILALDSIRDWAVRYNKLYKSLEERDFTHASKAFEWFRMVPRRSSKKHFNPIGIPRQVERYNFPAKVFDALTELASDDDLAFAVLRRVQRSQQRSDNQLHLDQAEHYMGLTDLLYG